ncbi:MAG: 1-deoxy-D-xylulose-5-phosphate reductoisomerase, partial [Syntrophothermus sp.]
MKRVLILGSTGSIGTQALEVIGASEGLRVAGLAARADWEGVVRQARALGLPAVAIAEPAAAARAAEAWSGRVLAGEEGVRDLIAATEPDLVLNAIVGAAGLSSTV